MLFPNPWAWLNKVAMRYSVTAQQWIFPYAITIIDDHAATSWMTKSTLYNALRPKKRLPVNERTAFCGWKMGLEPTTLGTTIQCSNQLSYIHHLNNPYFFTETQIRKYTFSLIGGWKMGLEPTTLGTTIQCSNQLSYIHHLMPFNELISFKTAQR